MYFKIGYVFRNINQEICCRDVDEAMTAAAVGGQSTSTVSVSGQPQNQPPAGFRFTPPGAVAQTTSTDPAAGFRFSQTAGDTGQQKQGVAPFLFGNPTGTAVQTTPAVTLAGHYLSQSEG